MSSLGFLLAQSIPDWVSEEVGNQKCHGQTKKAQGEPALRSEGQQRGSLLTQNTLDTNSYTLAVGHRKTMPHLPAKSEWEFKLPLLTSYMSTPLVPTTPPHHWGAVGACW